MKAGAVAFAVLGGLGLRLCQPRRGGAVVLFVKLNAEILAAKLTRCDQCRTGTGERIKHDTLRRAKRLYQRL